MKSHAKVDSASEKTETNSKKETYDAVVVAVSCTEKKSTFSKKHFIEVRKYEKVIKLVI